MAANTSGTALTIKLLIDCSPLGRRVVFAEAGKDAVDFLFSLLAMPAGTAVRLVGKDSMVGSAGNLYTSVEKLNDNYVQPGANKDALLRPKVHSPVAASHTSLLCLPEPSSAPGFFTCSNTYYRSNCRNYTTDASGATCPSCGNAMATAFNYVPPASVTRGAKGFVQGGTATYTVTDDLMIWPMSNISSIALLNTVAVRDLGMLQEKTVQLGYKEGVEILKASLQSKTVLTDVFLGKKPTSTNNGTTPSLNNGRALAWGA